MSKTSSTGKSSRSTSKAKPPGPAKVNGASKLATLLTLLRRPNGATIQELAAATNWQNHSVRGALAGALKKKGHTISSEVVDDVRRYRIEEAQG